MKPETLPTKIRNPEFGDGATTVRSLIDFNVARVGQLPRLHVQVAIRQARRVFHLAKGDRQTRNQGCQDAEATGGADHLVEFKLHGGHSLYFAKYRPGTRPCQALKAQTSAFYFIL